MWYDDISIIFCNNVHALIYYLLAIQLLHVKCAIKIFVQCDIEIYENYVKFLVHSYHKYALAILKDSKRSI